MADPGSASSSPGSAASPPAAAAAAVVSRGKGADGAVGARERVGPLGRTVEILKGCVGSYPRLIELLVAHDAKEREEAAAA
jgi:hypothetical protein